MPEQVRLEDGFVARVASEQLSAGVLGEKRTAAKCIDDQILRVRQSSTRRTSQQEVARKIDSFYTESGSPCDFHIEQRQRDGNARPAIEDLVEEAVARI